jgi:hypothetical protein
VRFLSIEPLLEDVGSLDLRGIHWVIVGGESGSGARPMKREWVIGILDQCIKPNVPFFFKQWGKLKFNPDPTDPTAKSRKNRDGAKGGRLLDDETYDESPLRLLRHPRERKVTPPEVHRALIRELEAKYQDLKANVCSQLVNVSLPRRRATGT